jgi:methylglyoxal synthase
MDGTVTRQLNSDCLRPIVALVAHDGRKQEMAEWAAYNKETLSRCSIYATRTTGVALANALATPVNSLLSGPLGGDAQLGSLIAEGRLDIVFFFWDPLTTQPHDVDVKALLRLAVLYNIPIACNRSSADFLISSPLFRDPPKHRAPQRASAAEVEPLERTN